MTDEHILEEGDRYYRLYGRIYDRVEIFHEDDLFKEIEEYAQKGEKRFVEETRFPVWATPVVMAIVLGLLSSEWYLRRRWGLM